MGAICSIGDAGAGCCSLVDDATGRAGVKAGCGSTSGKIGAFSIGRETEALAGGVAGIRFSAFNCGDGWAGRLGEANGCRMRSMSI